MSVFSERMKKRRVQLGLTQKQVYERAEIVERQYRYYESGEQEPTVMRAAAIARALETSLDYLAGLMDGE